MHAEVHWRNLVSRARPRERGSPPLGAVGHLELAANVRNVILDRLQADRKLAGDLEIDAALGRQPQHLALAVGQFGKNVRIRTGRVEEAYQPPDNRRADDSLRIGYRAEHLSLACTLAH